MGNVYHTSDWHLGHRGLRRFRTDFENDVDSDNAILANYRKVIHKRDLVWFHGDIIFDPKYLQVVADLPGTKNLIMGNHDTEKKRKIQMSDLIEVFDNIHSLVSYKGTWLSHAPIHPEELRGKFNIHGHTHYHVIDDERYINVCVEQTRYAPVSRYELLAKNEAFQKALEEKKNYKSK